MTPYPNSHYIKTNNPHLLPRLLMARLVFGVLILFLLYLAVNNSLIHQWQQPPTIYPEADNLFWLLHILYIPQLIMRFKGTALLFDIIIFLSTLLFFLFPRISVFAIISATCFWLLHICYCSAAGHHYAHVGYLLLPIPFGFKNERRFLFCWKLVRFWAAFLLLSAGIYKLYYGGFFYEHNMRNILKTTQPLNNWRGYFILYLIYHPFLAQFFYRAACFIQLSFCIAFFTYRHDLLLFILLLSFFLFDLLLVGIPFWENGLLLVLFLPWYKWKEQDKITMSGLRQLFS